MKLINKNEYLLSTGKTISPHQEVIGLTESSDYLSICDGYDGHFQVEGDENYEGFEDNWNCLTKEEAIEVANYMSDLWKDFANKLHEKEIK